MSYPQKTLSTLCDEVVVGHVGPSSSHRLDDGIPFLMGKNKSTGAGELARPRTAQSFCVPKADLAAHGYDLSLNRYKEIVHAEVAHRPPGEILKALGQLEAEIQQGMKELEGMLR